MLLKSMILMLACAAAHAQTVVEFREGDRLPITLRADGDLIETSRAAAGEMVVKRRFFATTTAEGMLISLDGKTYRPVRELVAGQLTASAGGGEGGLAESLALGLTARLKK